MPASTALPDEERVRELTADPKLTDDDANRYGDQFADAGKLVQALLFYERSKDSQRLRRVHDEAIRGGDAFLLQTLNRILPDSVEEQDWRDCGDRALKDGKFLFARDCFEKAGDTEKFQAAHEAYLKIFRKDQPGRDAPLPPPA